MSSKKQEPEIETEVVEEDEPMTPEEEWEIINTSGFDQDLNTKIQAIRTAMTAEEATGTPPGIETNVNGVYVIFHEEGNFLQINVGKTSEGHPQVSMNIPSAWLEA